MIGLSIISIIILFFVALDSTIVQYGSPQYDVALLRIIVILMISSIPPLVAHARNLAKRNTIYWLSFCWIIPCSWIIALCMAIFGKSEPIDSDDDEPSQEQTEEDSNKKQHTDFMQEIVYNESFEYKTQYPYNNQIRNNAIDRAVYKMRQSAKNSVSTVRNSKVVRGTVSWLFKILMIIAIISILGLIHMFIAEKNTPRYTNTYHGQKSIQNIHPQPKSYTQQPATLQKSAEQIWFEQAAASMK